MRCKKVRFFLWSKYLVFRGVAKEVKKTYNYFAKSFGWKEIVSVYLHPLSETTICFTRQKFTGRLEYHKGKQIEFCPF
ncbi:hypothetical protein BST97_14485 [Nonlabens spongiae]|uniref:Uncharacterized protein n=1 Tax=Nonlabens spongiae TaxID=331648 RepID=A0A1W6MND9_9FLAO|nr:hypothetical protein BST97_14485 [Nonlabens spongiae]